MARVELGKARSQIHETAQGLEIVIPSRRNYFLILFVGFWLVGWSVGEVTVASQLLSGKTHGATLFMLAWLGAWTVGGGFAIYAWLWNVMGKEVVRVNGVELQTTRLIGGFKRSQEYELAHVHLLRVEASAPWFSGARSYEMWGLGRGTIAFDYGQRTCRFGAGLDEAEARHLIAAIQQRYKLD